MMPQSWSIKWSMLPPEIDVSLFYVTKIWHQLSYLANIKSHSKKSYLTKKNTRAGKSWIRFLSNEQPAHGSKDLTKQGLPSILFKLLLLLLLLLLLILLLKKIFWRQTLLFGKIFASLSSTLIGQKPEELRWNSGGFPTDGFMIFRLRISLTIKKN